MFSSLNRWNNRVNTSWDVNANTYTGGGGTVIPINMHPSRIQY